MTAKLEKKSGCIVCSQEDTDDLEMRVRRNIIRFAVHPHPKDCANRVLIHVMKVAKELQAEVQMKEKEVARVKKDLENANGKVTVQTAQISLLETYKKQYEELLAKEAAKTAEEEEKDAKIANLEAEIQDLEARVKEDEGLLKEEVSVTAIDENAEKERMEKESMEQQRQDELWLNFLQSRAFCGARMLLLKAALFEPSTIHLVKVGGNQPLDTLVFGDGDPETKRFVQEVYEQERKKFKACEEYIANHVKSLKDSFTALDVQMAMESVNFVAVRNEPGVSGGKPPAPTQ